MGMPFSVSLVVAIGLGALVGAGAVSGARAELEPDETGVSLTLPPPAPHQVWLPDVVLRHSKLFDGDTGQVLGIVDATWGPSGRPPLLSRARNELYVVEPVYERGHRGARRDFVTIYDAVTLDVKGEIEIPPRSAEVGHGVALVGLEDDQRFLAIFNQDPSNSVSIVDLETRRFVEEIVIAGCALVYPTGSRSFGTLCGDGTALELQLDEQGHEQRQVASDPFFEVIDDPLHDKGARDGARWLFASFEGYLHEIDFSGERPVVAARWSLFDEAQRNQKWRIGGARHSAFHRGTGQLYVLVHQGERGSHKDPGAEVWVYDVKARARVRTIQAASLLPAFLRPQMDVARGSWMDWLLGAVLPNPGVHSIAVTQDDAPLLFMRHGEIGAVGVYDATSGRHLRDLDEVGIAGAGIVVP